MECSRPSSKSARFWRPTGILLFKKLYFSPVEIRSIILNTIFLKFLVYNQWIVISLSINLWWVIPRSKLNWHFFYILIRPMLSNLLICLSYTGKRLSGKQFIYEISNTNSERLRVHCAIYQCFDKMTKMSLYDLVWLVDMV